MLGLLNGVGIIPTSSCVCGHGTVQTLSFCIILSSKMAVNKNRHCFWERGRPAVPAQLSS
eukprot:7297987-Karenia_brevis.AAC.1